MTQEQIETELQYVARSVTVHRANQTPQLEAARERLLELCKAYVALSLNGGGE